MSLSAVCDAWLLELQDVDGLVDATQHRYASWSSAAVADSTPGRHVAVWPEGDPEVLKGAATDYSDEITTHYVIQVWEGATSETTRVYDDDNANAAWLALYEAVVDRLYEKSNLNLGEANSDVHYAGGRLDSIGDKRVFAIRFAKRRYKSFTA